MTHQVYADEHFFLFDDSTFFSQFTSTLRLQCWWWNQQVQNGNDYYNRIDFQFELHYFQIFLWSFFWMENWPQKFAVWVTGNMKWFLVYFGSNLKVYLNCNRFVPSCWSIFWKILEEIHSNYVNNQENFLKLEKKLAG